MRAIGAAIAVAATLATTVGMTLRPAAPAEAQTGTAVTLFELETVRANGADLRWTPFSGTGFAGYEVHRGSTATFTPSATTLLTTIKDVNVTSYEDTTGAPAQAYTYKVIAAGLPSAGRSATTPASGTATTTLQPLPADGKATYVQKAASGAVSCTNNGARDRIYAGAQSTVDRPLVQFDVSDLPAGATISSARLQLYRDVPTSRALTVDVHPVRSEWEEGSGTPSCAGTGASWDDTEGGVRWQAKGGDFLPTAAASVTHAASAVAGWDTFDVKAVAQDWAAGESPNLGLLLKLRDETLVSGNIVGYFSDDAADATKRPKLTVTYTDPSAKSEKPSAELAAPEDGALVSGTAVPLEAAVGDDRKVSQVQFLVDGAVVATKTAAPWTATWNSSTVANGTHTMNVKATDDVGNVRSSPTASITVGNSALPAAKVITPSSAYADVVRGAGAAGHWRLGETSGTTVADASGNGRSGTLSGSYLLGQPSLLTNDANPSVKFQNASTDGRVTINGLTGQAGSALTAEVWADTAAVASTTGISRLLSRGWGAAGGWRLGVAKGTDGQQRVSLTVNVAGVEKTTESVIAPGKHHLAGRYTGSTMGLFVDGVYKSGVSVAAQALNTTAPVYIGETLLDHVVIDEAAVYPSALSTDEGRRNWEVGTGRAVTFNGANEPVVSDASDDGSVDKVEFYLDGERFGTDSTVPYDSSLDTGDVEQPVWNGTHTITSKAYDDHGQEKDSATSTVTVDNTGGNPKFAATLTTSPVPQAVTYDPAATAQLDHGIDVTVKNDSPQTFTAADVVIRPRWIPPDPAAAIVEGTEVPLSADLGAGQSATRRVSVKPPTLAAGDERAEWTLRMDLYSKSSAAYFAAKGSKPNDNPVIVNKALADSLGLEKFWHYEGEQLGGGMQHLTNVANGNSLVRFTPMSSVGRGLSKVVDLTYNAREQKSESPIGNNWSLSISSLTRFGNPIDIHPNKADELAGRNANRFVDITDGDGTTHRFTGSVGADGRVRWQEPPGVHLYLRTTDSADPARKWAITRPDRVTFYYDAEGYPTSVEDRNGNRITYALEATPPGEDPGGPKKRITAVTDASGRAFAIHYWTKADAQKPHVRGKIRKIVDHSGAETTFQYYDDGNLLRVAQTGGKRGDGSALSSRAWYFTYTTSNGDGPAIPDAADRQHPDAKTANQSTRLFSVRDARKYESTFSYLGSGNGTDRWKIQSRTDRAGHTTSYAYDNVLRSTTVTAPLSRVSKYGYDARGRVDKVTNPKNELTTVLWNAANKVERVTQPTGKFKEYRYNANGYLTQSWDELRNQTLLEYEDKPADAYDLGNHVSQLKHKTDPMGTRPESSAPDDFRWSWIYDAKGNPTKSIDPENGETDYFYNGDGTLDYVLDPNDKKTDFIAHDPSGQPTEILDAEGGTTRFGYDADGFLRWVQDAEHASDSGGDPREYRSYFDYDSWHRMDRQSTPKSTSTARRTLIWSAVKHDANDNVIESIAPHFGEQYTGTGSLSTMQYDRMDRIERTYGADRSVDTANGERWRYSYDAAGRLIQQTDPRGMATLENDRDGATYFEYDQLDRMTMQWRELLEGSTTTVKETHRTHHCYDLAGDLRATVPPKADAVTVDCSNLAALPRATRYDYDDAHRLKVVTDPLNRKRSYDYDANSRIQFEYDAAQTRTEYHYDERGLMTKLVQPFDGVKKLTSRMVYDPAGNVVEETSPRGWDAAADDKLSFPHYTTRYEYDGRNRLKTVKLPTSAAYPEQHYIHHRYDRNGNATLTTQPTVHASVDNVPAEHRTVSTYWDTGRVRSTHDAPNTRVHFDYTAEGWQRMRVPEKTDGTWDESRKREWSYSPDGDLLEQRVGTEELGYAIDTFTYDANDQLATAHDTSGLANLVKQAAKDVKVQRDSLDRVTWVGEKTDKETNWTVTLSGFDRNGNVSSRTDHREETDAGAMVKPGRKHDFTYDAADWLETHRDYGNTDAASDDRLISNSFDVTGTEKQRVVKHADSTGAFQTKQTTNWTWHLNGLLKTLETVNGSGAVKEKHSLTYDDANGDFANGHRVTDTFRLDGAQSSDTCRTADCVSTYVYDARDRLVEEKTDRAGAAKTTKYTLDPTGNIRREERGGRVHASEYEGDRMTSQTVTENGVSVTAKYWHDPVSGTLSCVTKSGGSRTDCNPATGTSPSANLLQDYAYDAENRLSSYRRYDGSGSTTAKDSADYTYDAFDRLTEETENHTGFATPRATKFNYLGLSTMVSQEEQYKTSVTGTLDETKTYSYDAYGRRTGLTDAPVNGTKRDYTYAFDVHGSVSLLLDDAGKAQASYGYTPYGETDDQLTREKDPSDATGTKTLAKDNPLNAYRYTDKRLDPGSGTLDMGARRFGPDTTRFLQEDAFDDALGDLGLGADPLTGNRYSLAAGNPISFVETDGHMVARDGGGASAPSPKRTSSSGGSSSSSGSSAFKKAVAPPRWLQTRLQKHRRADERAPNRGNLLDMALGEFEGFTGVPVPRGLVNEDSEGFTGGVAWGEDVSNLTGVGAIRNKVKKRLKKELVDASTDRVDESVEAAREVTRRAGVGKAVSPGKKGWSRGDDIYAKTRAGDDPSWSTVRGRFWKNVAGDPSAAAQWDVGNIERMKKGLAPRRYNPDKGDFESMELSHEPIPRRSGGLDVVPKWPQEHARDDPFRHVNY